MSILPIIIKKKRMLQGSKMKPFDELAPSAVTLTDLSESSIKVDFTINSVNAEGHKIERSLDNITYTEVGTVTGATATFTNTGLSEATLYYYRVRAYKKTVNSEYSEAANKRTMFVFATADGSQPIDITLRLPIGQSVIMNWGDGSSSTYVGAGLSTGISMQKTYAIAGSYPMKLSGNYMSLTHIVCLSNSLTGDVSGWSVLINLISLICHLNSLTGDVSGWSALTNLSYLSCRNNSLTGDVSGWSALTNLKQLHCNTNSLTGDASGWSALTNLTLLRCGLNSLTGLAIAAKAISDCNASFNAFTTNAVNAFLFNTANYFENNIPTANCTFNLSGANMGIPTGGAANADITRLVGYYTAASMTATVIVRTS